MTIDEWGRVRLEGFVRGLCWRRFGDGLLMAPVFAGGVHVLPWSADASWRADSRGALGRSGEFERVGAAGGGDGAVRRGGIPVSGEGRRCGGAAVGRAGRGEG